MYVRVTFYAHTIITEAFFHIKRSVLKNKYCIILINFHDNADILHHFQRIWAKKVSGLFWI